MASISLPKSIFKAGSGVRINVWAKPGAKKANVLSIDDEAVGIAINAPPREGAANEALCEFVAEIVGVKRSKATLEAGGKSRTKVVEVETSQTAEEVYAKFKQSMEDS